MSIAGPIEDAAGRPSRPRLPVSRRTVLGTAVAGGAGIAAVRLLALGKDQIEAAVRGRAAAGRPDWISPLGSEKARVAHLLRRATFGAGLEDLERAASDGYARTVDRLLEARPAPAPDFVAADGTRGGRLNLGQLQLWWVQHILATPTPLAERMTLFWHGHFTSDYRKVGLQTPFIHWQNLTWRDMALTDLRSMLMRVTTDPAMLRYLDLSTSTGQNPNENYARELLELFTMGVGNYSEDDVRAAAKALAGWTEPRAGRQAVFDQQVTGTFVASRAYRGGPLTFLGRKDTYDTEKVIDRILAHPATAPFIARRVVQQFVSSRIDDGYVKGLGDRFRASKYDVKTLLHAVFTSPEFAAEQSYRALVKSPVEFMVHTLKALNAPRLARLVVQSGANMGQVLFDPPDVGGWPTNEAWISSNNVIARVNFVTQALGQLETAPPAADAPRHIDVVLSPQTASQLNKAADDTARWFLTLASPEFQLK